MYRLRVERSLRHIAVVGVSASGKDYLLERASAEGYLPRTSRIINVGQQMAGLLGADRDSLRTADLFAIAEARETVMHGAIAAATPTKDTLIFNAHMVHWHQEVGYSYRPASGSPRACGGLLPPDGGLASERFMFAGLSPSPRVFVHVGADPEQIQAWRAGDVSRQRRTESLEEIAAHQAYSLDETMRAAQMTGAECIVLYNSPKPEITAANVSFIGRTVLLNQ